MRSTLRYRFFTTVIIILFSVLLPLSAQNKIKVLDQATNTPIQGVSVQSDDLTKGTVTNKDGEFFLKDLPKIKETDILHFSHVSYTGKSISLRETIDNNYTVFLTENTRSLQGVTVEGKKIELKPFLSYKKLASMPKGLFSFGAQLVGDKIYVVGGNESVEQDDGLKAMSEANPHAQERGNEAMFEEFAKRLESSTKWVAYNNKMYIYDITSGKWETSKHEFKDRAYLNMNYFNGKLYILGGKRLSTNRKFEYLDETLEIYDIRKDKIHTDKTNPHQAINFMSDICEDNIIVMGGSVKFRETSVKETKSYSDKIHLLNLKTGYWYQLGDMPQGKEAKGIVIGNKAYLIGGYNTKALETIELYDLSSGKWDTGTLLLYPCERPAITYNDNIIYIFDDGKIQTYNTRNGEINAYLINLNLKYAEIYFHNEKLYILGGYEYNEFSKTPSASLYSVEFSEFKKTEKFNTNIRN
ncbi:hypothetical protein GGR21_000548 [Dysgonomonas hofstadii]|uniref:Galactose oxidase n=1 Tax=Dysgonomonas hofstadii TaxID=637886 RepID=A0A840CHG8_9BACT|nr:carboxypeptidase-like regulatory domain-containing protein [Dysgonomonas hofstadii]MBB4034661.1 hypothetical protein [Dysgonomonas hofstadii]